MAQRSVPPRPPAWHEGVALSAFLALSPRLGRIPPPEPPPERLAPFESVTVPRRTGRGPLTATWYPAEGRARGGVLLVHPWLIWGKGYFHVRGRVEALRAAGYHVLAVDLPGFGASGPPDGFFDRDVEVGIEFLLQRLGNLPLHVWGVSSGGYWAHLYLSRTDVVAGAMFEDVAPHLLEWSWREMPLYRLGYLLFRRFLRSAYGFLDLRRHAAAMSLGAVTYVSGERDRGVRPEDTRMLADLAGGRCHIVEGAGHLASIKTATEEVISLALDTFQRAEEGRQAASALAEASPARSRPQISQMKLAASTMIGR
jgi:Alpha/beta hydrolase family